MDFTVIFHKDAEVEYSESFVWYELRSDGLGFRFQNAVNATIEKIKSNPEIFSRKRAGFREAPITGFPFKVVYYILKEEREIFISSVFHMSRNPSKKYRKK